MGKYVACFVDGSTGDVFEDYCTEGGFEGGCGEQGGRFVLGDLDSGFFGYLDLQRSAPCQKFVPEIFFFFSIEQQNQQFLKYLTQRF